jgi:hypothetical protein
LKVSQYPDLVQQLAWQVARMYKDNLKVSDVKVLAYLPMEYNNRKPALVIDPTVDLAATSSTIRHDPWLKETNPNPLRRVEQVNRDERRQPSLQQLLGSFDFPSIGNCLAGSLTSDLHDVVVCTQNSNDWNAAW